MCSIESSIKIIACLKSSLRNCHAQARVGFSSAAAALTNDPFAKNLLKTFRQKSYKRQITFGFLCQICLFYGGQMNYTKFETKSQLGLTIKATNKIGGLNRGLGFGALLHKEQYLGPTTQLGPIAIKDDDEKVYPGFGLGIFSDYCTWNDDPKRWTVQQSGSHDFIDILKFLGLEETA